jgi:hypothetical protein
MTTLPAFLKGAIAFKFCFFKHNIGSFVIVLASFAEIIIGQVKGMEALAHNGSRQATIACVPSMNKGFSILLLLLLGIRLFFETVPSRGSDGRRSFCRSFRGCHDWWILHNSRSSS